MPRLPTVLTLSAALAAGYVLLTANVPAAPPAAGKTPGNLSPKEEVPATREVILSPDRLLAPVTVAMWDAGAAAASGPVTSTVAQAHQDAEAVRRSVAYFKAVGARVVNMDRLDDWKGSKATLPVRRTAQPHSILTRQIASIRHDALYAAIKGAPGILFVAGAGTEGGIPPDVGAWGLPNMLVVGAAGQAGHGAVSADIYAEGSPPAGDVTGGDALAGRGPSTAGPQVTNLAAKILAMAPDLTPPQVRALILKAGEARVSNGMTIRLLCPAQTLALLQGAGRPVETFQTQLVAEPA